MSIRDAVAAAADRSTNLVEVPEWGVTIEFTELSLDAAVRWGNARVAAEGDDLATARLFAELVIATAMDPETGEPAFGAADLGMLRGKNGNVVSRLAMEAMRLNGMTSDAVDEGKAGSSTPIEDPSTGSATGSATASAA